MLDFDRLDESMWMLGNILPLGNAENRAKLRKKLGTTMPLDSFIGVLMKSLTEMCREFPAEAEGYLDFIKESIQYSLHQRETPAETSYDPEDVKRLYQIRKIQEKKNG